MRFRLTDEQRMIKNLAAELAETEFSDDAFTWETEFPEANKDVLAEQGLLGIALPEEYGGGGYDVIEVLLAQEAVGRVCPDTAHVLSRSSMGPPRVIATLGNDYLKEKYLQDVCDGEMIMSVAISESEAGTDAAAMSTTVERADDGILLNGTKQWVTKADVCGAFLVYAKFPDGNIGAVVVDADTPGFSLGQAYTNMAGHEQYELEFDDCELPEEQILAEGKESFKNLLIEFNVERTHNAMMCVACGLNAFDKAMAYAKDREQFGEQISEFQGIEWKFADMAMKLEAARLLIYRAAVNAIDSPPSRLETSLAKVVANEFGDEVVDEALQVQGAMGYMKESPVEYLYRWVRGWRIAGGTTEIQRNMIARDLKKHGLD
ncbi:acyl-CoA dehydrogenase [Halorubellus sp. JP-L1]|uniref:acyl-CoA dehydrogenase family protein n=1 Tax=Halorubellus sp. JP-L1 TaxID=2715753 RepID=UPI00140C226B|nr:acyl-CoA dehydrogenase family protein [Halorubellus sp. JP-L1]NHN42808.1 acyl-CoA dehydrogenase [Halorubellus sp. JP-L1]